MIYKKWLKIVCLIGTLVLTACASETEKEERRQNAFDISGGYKVRKELGSELDMDFEIFNERGRYDIFVELDRKSEMTASEIKLLNSYEVDDQKVWRHFDKKIVLGKGRSYIDVDGGDNISKDFGLTSEFKVCSDKMKYSDMITLSYCLSGTAKKDLKEMNGTLSLTVTRTEKTKDKDGKEVTSIESESVSLNFVTDMKMVFYKQYLGLWTGEVFNYTDAKDLNKLTSISIVEDGKNNRYYLKAEPSKLHYSGETFEWNLEESSAESSFLIDPSYPAVHMVFRSSSGKRIILTGQLWSLGDFTGSIILIEEHKEVDLGSFRYSKL